MLSKLAVAKRLEFMFQCLILQVWLLGRQALSLVQVGHKLLDNLINLVITLVAKESSSKLQYAKEPNTCMYVELKY